jgi:hypothetical protein
MRLRRHPVIGAVFAVLGLALAAPAAALAQRNSLERGLLEGMAPYPASLFKLLVGFHALRLVDRGILDLDAGYAYDPAGGCGGAAPGTATNRRWLDAMITSSDNRSACALLKELHGLGEVDGMNAELRELGLGTLQVNGTSRLTGASWQPGQIHMTALDTARLLWLIEGAPGVLWLRPDGRPVRASVLSDASRALLRQLLAEQGFNVVLSTTNFCGATTRSPASRSDRRPLDRRHRRHRDRRGDPLRAGRAPVQRAAEEAATRIVLPRA